MLGLMFALSGCGDSIKSVEEYSKLSKAELESMYKECEGRIEEKYEKRYPKEKIITENDLKVALEFEQKVKQHEREIYEITDKIFKSRGEKISSVAKARLGLAYYGQVSDDELNTFGNSTYAEYVQCGRIKIAKEGGIENILKSTSAVERYKNIGK